MKTPLWTLKTLFTDFMNTIFYIAAFVSVITSLLAITNRNAIHALLYLILSLLSISVIFYILGAPLSAALEVIVYAGAIMVLFIFVVMMLNIGMEEKLEKNWLRPRMWILPAVLSAILLAILIYVAGIFSDEAVSAEVISPKAVGMKLFTTYLLEVELAAMLLLAGIVGAYHIGRRRKKIIHRFLEITGKKE